MTADVERYADDEVVTRLIDGVVSWMPPAMKRRLFFTGYEAFFNDRLLKNCGYSDRSPSYELYRAGWAQAFRDYTAALAKRTGRTSGEDTITPDC